MFLTAQLSGTLDVSRALHRIERRQTAENEPSCGDGVMDAYLRSYGRLRGVLLRRTGCPAAADDLSQDMYLRVAGKRNAPVGNPSGYLSRMAGNMAIDWHRGAARELAAGAVPEDLVSEAPSAETSVLARERLDLVLRIADGLPPRCREVFVMRKLEGLDQRAIAEGLGISLNMVQKHLRKALEDIAAALETFE